MMNFRDYMEQSERVHGGKPWKAKRADVLQFWQNLQPNMPLQPTPIEKKHHGTRFRRDGIRITGTARFINSVLSHLKEFLAYEQNPQTKIDVEYRQIESKEGEYQSGPIYVCYIYVMQRGN